MSHLTRICALLLVLLPSLVRADLGVLWTHRGTGGIGVIYSVEATLFDPNLDVIVAGTITTDATNTDIWVTKLDRTTGQPIWEFRKNGVLGLNDKLGGIAIAPNGDVYVAGQVFNSNNALGVPQADGFLARLDASAGTAVWENPSGPASMEDDAWHAVALDEGNNPVVTGIINDAAQSGQIRTAKFSTASGGLIWEKTFDAFNAAILDSGERIFLDAGGNVYVQGRHAAGTVTGVDVDPTVVIVSYTPAGEFRFGERYHEAPNANAFGFAPSTAGGFIVGITQVNVENVNFHRVSRGNPDGSVFTDVPLPLVTTFPRFSIADNGDILFSGRGPADTDGERMVVGRLAPGNLSTHWSKLLDNRGPAAATAFAHVPFEDAGSVMAGIGPGSATQDLFAGVFDKDGGPAEGRVLDGGATTTPVQDFLPNGPTLDWDGGRGFVVATLTRNAAGHIIPLVRRMRISQAPTITWSVPKPADPNVEAFTPVKLTVAPNDVDGDAVQVDFLVNGTSVGAATAAPFEVDHTFSATGSYTVEAVATDVTGLVTSTGPLTVVAHVPIPVVTTGAAARTGPSAGTFSGMVGALPLGGVAHFEFKFAGETAGPGFSTQTMNLPAGPGPFPVTIPFDIPAPHRQYAYRLVVTATDGSETASGSDAGNTFTIPNAPVIAQPDFLFAPRGAIVGQPLSNDLDGDPGEQLTLSLASSTLPGTARLGANGLSFVPDRTFTGETSILYTADDKFGSTSSETIVLRNGLFYKGNYRALSPVNGVHLGAVDATVSAAGRATVVGWLNGIRFVFRGDLGLVAPNTVGLVGNIRHTTGNWTVKLSWAMDRTFTAQVEVPPSTSSEVETAQVLYTAVGMRAGPSSFTSAKIYTLAGPQTNVSGTPQGRVAAFAYLRVQPDGKATFRGKLGDGTGFVAKALLREDGRLAIYTPLQSRATSFLMGMLLPGEGDAVTDRFPFVAVQGPKIGRHPEFASNYRDEVALSGPLFIPPPPSSTALNFEAPNRTVTIQATGGDIGSGNFVMPIWIGRNAQLSGVSGINRIFVDGRNGEFRGSFVPVGQNKLIQFSGVLRQDANNGVGVFRGSTSAGSILISPN